ESSIPGPPHHAIVTYLKPLLNHTTSPLLTFCSQSVSSEPIRDHQRGHFSQLKNIILTNFRLS
ncbi:hypothetical protein G4B88_000633, partial [Cannabis sativa]